ncbi:hypothetical protein ABT173_00075 [Streptomyces sp. NPDC001795]|uniref:hypothetical protein n=1 Tax=Streptomyces sp. NPDC001795 TaxID=3154525 RepID=UPI00332CE110
MAGHPVRTEFDAASGEDLLRRACSEANVDPDGIELLRLGDHAVFRLAEGRIVARVARNPDRLPSVLYDTFDGTTSDGFPIVSAHLARSADHGVTFNDVVLATFQTPKDNGDPPRVA